MKHSIFRPAILSCLAIGLMLSCGGGGTSAPEHGMPAGPQPIIVIAIDGLRADSLGAYGGSLDTPNFDALAAQSAHFSWAFSQAPEAPVAFASLLTGLYPTTSGVVTSGDRVPPEATTLAEAFSDAGFATAAFIEGAAGGDDFGTSQGFSEFRVSDRPGQAAAGWIADNAGQDFLAVFRAWSVGLDFGPGVEVGDLAPPEGFFERLQVVLASDFTDEPLSLEPEDLSYVTTVYEHRVRAADAALGEFLAQLDEVGLGDRATLGVTGTTGLDLEQHGAAGSVSLHSTVTRVPLFIRMPGRAGAGEWGKIVEIVDVMPTLLDLAGLESPLGVQGSSLLPIVEGAGRPPYVAFSESPHLGGQQAVALGGMRLIRSLADGSVALFDLAADPAELEDRASEHPDRVEVLERHLEAWGKMVAAASLDPELRVEEELDDATLEQLKSLGYIQ